MAQKLEKQVLPSSFVSPSSSSSMSPRASPGPYQLKPACQGDQQPRQLHVPHLHPLISGCKRPAMLAAGLPEREDTVCSGVGAHVISSVGH